MEETSENKNNSIEKKDVTPKKRGCFFWGIFIVGLSTIFISLFMIFIFIVGIFSILSNGSALPLTSEKNNIKEEILSGSTFTSNKIAVIDIRGVIVNSTGSWGEIANSSLICSEIEMAENDNKVKALILRIDSPGGEVTAADTIYHAVCEFSKHTKKPVIVSMGSLAASGGVYVAMAADYIIANRLTTTGSIGVISHGYNYSELLKKIGVKAEIYKSGKMKDILNGARPRTKEEVEIIDEFILEVYDDFVKIVAEHRPKLTVEKIKNTPIGDGRFYSGRKALEYGLIDQLGYFNDAVKKAAEMAKLDDYKVVVYKPMMGLSDILFNMKATPPSLKLELPGTSKNVQIPGEGKFYLLPPQW